VSSRPCRQVPQIADSPHRGELHTGIQCDWYGVILRWKTLRKKTDEPATVQAADDPASLPGSLKAIGGSKNDNWNNTLAIQTLNCLTHSKDDQAAKRKHGAALAALIGIRPKDELEGMLAAQLVACHNASMEAYRRAMFPEQTFEGRHENLNQANKLSRTYATLLEA
jgi:hypothetical protein